MKIDVDCPKCGHKMEVRSDRTVHHETIVELSCPNCMHRETMALASRVDK